MKLIELVNSVEALNKLFETKLSASASFDISKFLKAISPDVEVFNKLKNEKVIAYGTPILDDSGNPTDQYSFNEPGTTELSENGKKFLEEMNELENKEIDVEIPKIKISDLGKAEIEPKYLSILSWLIKE